MYMHTHTFIHSCIYIYIYIYMYIHTYIYMCTAFEVLKTERSAGGSRAWQREFIMIVIIIIRSRSSSSSSCSSSSSSCSSCSSITIIIIISISSPCLCPCCVFRVLGISIPNTICSEWTDLDTAFTAKDAQRPFLSGALFLSNRFSTLGRRKSLEVCHRSPRWGRPKGAARTQAWPINPRLCVYMYIYIYIYICIYVCIEREREKDAYLCIYIYV